MAGLRLFEIRPLVRVPFDTLGVECAASDHEKGDKDDSDDAEFGMLNERSCSVVVRVRRRPGPGFVAIRTSFKGMREGPGSALRISSVRCSQY